MVTAASNTSTIAAICCLRFIRISATYPDRGLFQSWLILRETQELPEHSAKQISCRASPATLLSSRSLPTPPGFIRMRHERQAPALVSLFMAAAVSAILRLRVRVSAIARRDGFALSMLTAMPNGWQPKPAFFILIAVVILTPAIPAFIVPRRFPSIPADKINLPNKSYWLAPERREGNLAVSQRANGVVRLCPVVSAAVRHVTGDRREFTKRWSLQLARDVVRAWRFYAVYRGLDRSLAAPLLASARIAMPFVLIR